MSSMDAGRSRSLVLAGGLAAMAFAAGCATTGLAWVQEPESGVDPSAPSDDAAKSATGPRSAGGRPGAAPVAYLEAAPVPSARRIDRTITLGETTAVTGTSGEAVDRPGTSSPSVVINIYNAPASPAYGPAYGVSTGVVRSGAVRPSPAEGATMRPGLDWAPPPSYGPAFPYRMAPSSPWNGDGSERPRGR